MTVLEPEGTRPRPRGPCARSSWRLAVLALAAATTWLGPVRPARAQVPGDAGGLVFRPLPPDARVRLNLQDATLAELVAAISGITGRRFLMAARLPAVRVTIRTPTTVTPAEAWQAFLSALATNGLTIVRSGAFYTIVPADEAVRRNIPVYGAGAR